MKDLQIKKRKTRWLGILVVTVALLPFRVGTSWSEVTQEGLGVIKERLERVKAITQRLPEHKRWLPGSILRLTHLADEWDQIEPLLFLGSGGSGAGTPGPEILALRQVSDPSTDAFFSGFGGFTQSETSTAWCGHNVVVGFNDSGSFFEQLLVSPTLSLNINGFARSTNKGASFTDQEFLPSDPVPPGSISYWLLGDPVVKCTDPDTFYYASIAMNFTAGFSILSDISVSKSTDGGASFGSPVPAVSKPAATHFVDKPWMAVDPTDPQRLYVTYTDFDASGTSVACGALFRTAIELVRSTNGGETWNAPVVLAEVCGDPFVQGSQVAVGSYGEVYVTWEAGAADFVTREIDIRRSDDNGMTFGALVKVSDVTCVGSCGGTNVVPPGLLRGGFRALLELPSLAVDRSYRATKGNVYIAWHDARILTVNDGLSVSYGFADVLVSRSTDWGSTWSTPTRVNDNEEPLPSGGGTDQYQPGIAVDRRGKIGVCYYDRRRDSNNFLIDRSCARSRDGGVTWHNRRKTRRNFAAVPGQDKLINPVYMGDYDELASDFTQVYSGFIGAFADNSRGNPDVRINRLGRFKSKLVWKELKEFLAKHQVDD